MSPRQQWRDHSATIILASLLVAQTLLSLWSGTHVYPYEYHGQPRPNFWLWFVDRYNLSILADVFGGIVLIWIGKKGREKGSPETGDDE